MLTCLLERAPSSAQRQRVESVWHGCLHQMVTLFYPTCDAADDAEMQANAVIALQAYIDDLGGYRQDQVATAWAAARRAHRTRGWPTIQDILDQLPRSEKTATKPKLEGAPDWEKITKSATVAVADFMLGTMADEARAEGWAWPLEDYVKRVAAIQAQALDVIECGKSPVASDSVRRLGNLDDVERERRFCIAIPDADLERIKAQRMDPAHIERLKQEAEYRIRRAHNSSRAAA